LGDVTETAIKDNFDIVYMVSLWPLSLAVEADILAGGRDAR
jgi:hypothetical protein